MRRIPMMYIGYATVVLLVNLFGYYIPVIQENVEMTMFYQVMLPFQISVSAWFLYLVYRNAPLNENISIFMVVYFFLQAPFIISYGLRDVNQLYGFTDMMLMIVIGFSLTTLFILAIVDIWPKYVSFTIFGLLLLRVLNLSWMGLFDLYRVDQEVLFGTTIYAVLGIGVIVLEAYVLNRFYELEE